MKRARFDDLEAWLAHPKRKPLILRGARQVGKSWLVRSFATARGGTLTEVNFERRPELVDAFADNDPRATLRRLEALLATRVPFDGSALLFLDEIQAAPLVLSKLRWFAEELPSLPVVAAGSLLDFALADFAGSMPVGRVTYMHLEPMGFIEFAEALGEAQLVEWLRGDVTASTIAAGCEMPDALHARASELHRSWLLVGGMPAAVDAFRASRDLRAAQGIHRDIAATLRDDFGKYSSRVHHARLAAVLAAVPRQLGSKFAYHVVDRDERATALRKAVELLCAARVCHRVLRTSAEGGPLGAGADDRGYKLLALDVGMASTALGLDLHTIDDAYGLALANRGAIAEQSAGQLLRLTGPANEDPASFYWQRDKRGASAEVDYIQAVGPRVVPVEVKSGSAGRLKSLHTFMGERNLAIAVRIWSSPPLVHDVDVGTSEGKRASFRLVSLPAYLVEELPRLVTGIVAG